MLYDNAGDLKKKKGVKKFEIDILGKVELQQVFDSIIPDTLNSSQSKTWEKDRDALINYFLSYIWHITIAAGTVHGSKLNHQEKEISIDWTTFAISWQNKVNISLIFQYILRLLVELPTHSQRKK